MSHIEEKLWSYIDGTCSEEEREAIGKLIAHDEVYRKKHDELLAFEQSMQAMDLEEPPMAFTYNVMEAIRAEHAHQPLKTAIDKRIIRGISGFFILTILAILIYALTSASWSASHTVSTISGNAIKESKVFFTAPVLKAFLFFDVVLGLFLFDAYLRKNHSAKSF